MLSEKRIEISKKPKMKKEKPKKGKKNLVLNMHHEDGFGFGLIIAVGAFVTHLCRRRFRSPRRRRRSPKRRKRNERPSHSLYSFKSF